MSRVKVNELRGLSANELDQKKQTLQKDLHDLRQKKSMGTLEKPHLFKVIRRQIAQINTIRKEK
jgi:large subunit ribosomal protein L29